MLVLLLLLVLNFMLFVPLGIGLVATIVLTVYITRIARKALQKKVI